MIWANLVRMNRLVEVGTAFGVAVYVHWSALALAAVMAFGAIGRPALAISVLFSYAGVMLIHELGHTLVAQRCGSEVLSIELYPIHGITRYEETRTRYDECLIAWGGFAAQMVVAIPLIIWVLVFGYSPYEPVNAVFAILGYFSAVTAFFNLLPLRSLDGSKAWSLIPLAIQKWRSGARWHRAQSSPGPRFRVMK